MPYPLTTFIEGDALEHPDFQQGLLNHLRFWRTECPHTPHWILANSPIEDAIAANSASAQLIDRVLIDEPNQQDAHFVLTARAPDQSDAAFDEAPEIDFFSGQSPRVDIARSSINYRDRIVHDATIEAFRAVDAINSGLLGRETGSTAASADSNLYERTDALATKQVGEVRSAHKNMFMLSGIGCILTAVAAVVTSLTPLLMTLPVIVFWLLKLSAKYRNSKRWKTAILARSCAEMLRIRNAVSQIGLSGGEILRMVPRHWRGSMMPTAIALRACMVGERQPNDREMADRFVAWVTEQHGYYQAAIRREEKIAKSTLLTFDAAFTVLTVIATLAVAYSIAYPWLFPETHKSTLVGFASAIGGCLSSLGLIAINFGRERASGQTVKNYRHMLSVFESMRTRTETPPPELVAEAVAEHASWCGRFMP